jgi:hypothetical protein
VQHADPHARPLGGRDLPWVKSWTPSAENQRSHAASSLLPLGRTRVAARENMSPLVEERRGGAGRLRDPRGQGTGCQRSSHGIPVIESLDLPDPHRPGLVEARAVTDFKAPSSKMAIAQMQNEEVRHLLHKFAVWLCQSEDDATDLVVKRVAPERGRGLRRVSREGGRAPLTLSNGATHHENRRHAERNHRPQADTSVPGGSYAGSDHRAGNAAHVARRCSELCRCRTEPQHRGAPFPLGARARSLHVRVPQ